MRRILFLLVLSGILGLAACGTSISSSAGQSKPATVQNRVIGAALLQGSNPGDWPMFGYNPGHTGSVDQLVHPQSIQGKLAWMYKLGPLFSAPVAGLHMLYIASTDGYLYALKQETGEIVWKTRLETYLTDATPTLAGQVLFVSMHGTALAALDAHTGQIYWTFESDEKIQAPPLVTGSRAVFATRTTLWVLDAASGRLLWKFQRGVSGWPTTGSPAIAGNIVYVGLGSGTQLSALNLLDGHLLWSFDTGDRITSAPLVEGGMVYVATWHGSIFALDRNIGVQRWSYSLNAKQKQSVVDGIAGSLALAAGRLYVGDYRGQILCLDAQQGKVVWRYATGAQVLATPIVVAGFVYVGSSDGYFYALDTHMGRPVWRSALGEVRSAAALGNNRLYVGSIDGTAYAFM